MRYLVTGGLGVIGSLLSRQMLDAGHDVTIIDPGAEPRNRWVMESLLSTSGYEGRLTILNCRIENVVGLEKLICEHQAIVHAAAHTGIPHSSIDPDDDWISNVDATRCLLNAIRINKTPPMVVLSSVKPYQVRHLPYRREGLRYVWESWAGNNANGIDEKWLVEADECYAASKLAQSALCQAYARSFDLPVVVLRCSNLYGPAPCHGPRHGWATWFCIAAAIGRTIRLDGTGYQVRDLLFASDVTSACQEALLAISMLKGEIFNIGGGKLQTTSLLEALQTISEFSGNAITSIPSPPRMNDDPIFITNFRRFHDATGWSPEVNVRNGLATTLAWAVEHREELTAVYGEVYA